jgi:hypothetical protein
VLGLKISSIFNLYFESEVNRMKGLNIFDWIAIVLLVIGGINWGLVGLTNFDIVETIFGGINFGARFVYVLVGLAAIYLGAVSVQFSRKDLPPNL